MIIPNKVRTEDCDLVQSILLRAKTSATCDRNRDVIWSTAFKLDFLRSPSPSELAEYKRERIHREKLNASTLILCAVEIADRLGIKIEGEGFNLRVVYPTNTWSRSGWDRDHQLPDSKELTGNERQEARERRLMQSEDDANFEAVWGDYIDRRPDRDY